MFSTLHLSNRPRLRNAVVTWLFAIFACHAEAAAPKVPELLETLSIAKGEAVGRAARIKSCQHLRDKKIIAELVLKYDDARNLYNSRLDGWIFSLKTKQALPADIAAETERLNSAFKKVREFTSSADAAMVGVGCPRRVAWQVPLVIALAVLAVSKAYDYFKEKSSDDNMRAELLRELEFLKIPAWESAGAVEAYDWNAKAYFASDEISLEILKRGSTSIYVNKWALTKKPNEFFVTYKEVPAALSGSHLLYTGPLESLKDFTDFDLRKKYGALRP